MHTSFCSRALHTTFSHELCTRASAHGLLHTGFRTRAFSHELLHTSSCTRAFSHKSSCTRAFVHTSFAHRLLHTSFVYGYRTRALYAGFAHRLFTELCTELCTRAFAHTSFLRDLLHTGFVHELLKQGFHTRSLSRALLSYCLAAGVRV